MKSRNEDIEDFAKELSTAEGFGLLYGIKKKPEESLSDFKKRIIKASKDHAKKCEKEFREKHGNGPFSLQDLFGEDGALTDREKDNETK